MFMEPLEVPKPITYEQKQAAPANPQSYLYFWVLFTIVNIIMFPFAAVPPILQHHPSRFKAHDGFFVMMTVASVSLAVVASGILILTSYFLRSWMKDIHYTILKSIGLFSALLAPFSLMCMVCLPMEKLTWITYSILCLTFVGILFLYHFLWKHACLYQQNKESNYYPFHWTTFLAPLFYRQNEEGNYYPINYTTFHAVLVPLTVTCVRCLPPTHEWAAVPIIIFVIFSIPFMVLVAIFRKV